MAMDYIIANFETLTEGYFFSIIDVIREKIFAK